MTNNDWLIELFSYVPTPEEIAQAAAQQEVEAQRLASLKAEQHYRETHRCPKCGGEGRLPNYSHIKGGECFRCGGTGVA